MLRGLIRQPEGAVEWIDDMAWTVPAHTPGDVDAAGAALVKPHPTLAELDEALDVINNWRSSHSFPLNTLQVGLRRNARLIDQNAVVAQRLKRLSSIQVKLKRFNWLTLSVMQDIGGCRAVVTSVRRVDKLVQLYKKGDLKHKLDDEDDYIRKPKKTDYRGVHLIYQYHSDRKETYNGLKIEMQIRSTLQHAWATAVETVGTFIQQALKSSQGEKEWLRFFALMGSAIASRERTPPVPGTPTDRKELVAELRQHARDLDVVGRLQAYGAALRTLEEPGQNAHYFLLALDSRAQEIKVTGYKVGELTRASDEYLATEREMSGRGGDAVLVSVESMAALRRAYPNYFLDTRVFIEAVQQAVGGGRLGHPRRRARATRRPRHLPAGAPPLWRAGRRRGRERVWMACDCGAGIAHPRELDQPGDQR